MTSDQPEYTIHPCLYCGGIMHLHNHQNVRFWLMCQNCSATSPSVETEERAVNLHNQTVQGVYSLQDMVDKQHAATMARFKKQVHDPDRETLTYGKFMRSPCCRCDQSMDGIYKMPDGMLIDLCRACAEKHRAILAD
jgi:hypothetical protein